MRRVKEYDLMLDGRLPILIVATSHAEAEKMAALWLKEQKHISATWEIVKPAERHFKKQCSRDFLYSQEIEKFGLEDLRL